MAKSQGLAPSSGQKTAAHTHAVLRATDGFSIVQLDAEYRALRASVLRLWAETRPVGDGVAADIGRFNEAIDQALVESVTSFSAEVERWRHLFLGVLGHELRGPLSAIVLTSQVVRQLTAGTRASEAAQRSERNGQRMAALLDELLEYNRSALGVGIPVRRTFCDLSEAVLEEVELRRAALPAVDIQYLPEGPCPALWDVSRLKQVVGNLVSNAAHHGAAGGAIHVRLQTGHEVRLSVSNTGPAIPEALQQTMFEPLRTASRSSSASTHMGLGLFIARAVVQAHGGRLEVQSDDQLMVFTAVLPRQP